MNAAPHYYNEFDPKAAEWLRELMRLRLIPQGHVDTRSILDVVPSDLDGFAQCHFFAGIGGWPLALRLAGWPEDRPVWTGSCPCQPFSAAGKGKGSEDERHLWPVFRDLIAACRPPVVFGEQVASALVVGKAGGKTAGDAGTCWLDGVSADMDVAGYSVGAAVLGAHSVGAPHIRQRLYWVADSQCEGRERNDAGNGTRRISPSASRHSAAMRWASAFGWKRVSFAADCMRSGEWDGTDEPGDICSLCGLDYCEDCECPGPTQSDEYEYHERDGILFARPHDHVERLADSDSGRNRGDYPRTNQRTIQETNAGDHWSRFDIIPCRDGKFRRIPKQDGVEPVLQRVVDGLPLDVDARRIVLDAILGFPLSEKVPGRVKLLRGYGNAIVPQDAAAFITAYTDIT